MYDVFYNSHGTTKEKPTVDTQKIKRKKSRPTTAENHQIKRNSAKVF